MRNKLESDFEPWPQHNATYDRTWVEIEDLLEQAIQEMKTQHVRYVMRKHQGQRKAMFRALLKFQRAKAIVHTLRWTIGMKGQPSPLEGEVIQVDDE